MKEKLFLGDGFLFLGRAPQRRRGGLVKWVFSVQWGDRAESERRKVEQARREDLRNLARREPGIVLSEVGNQRVDHEAVLEVVPPLVELEPLLLLGCSPHRRYAMVLGRYWPRRRILVGF